MEYKHMVTVKDKLEQKECAGLCDIAECDNMDCPKWKEIYKREQMREWLEAQLSLEVNY